MQGMMKVEATVDFKRASPGEWTVVQSIAYETWPVAYGHLLPAGQLDDMLEAIYCEEALRRQFEDGHVFWLGYEAEQLMGFASIEKTRHLAGQLMIHKLYVRPSCQGRGVGRAFVRYLTAEAQRLNCQALRLKVFHLNRAAIQFYQRLGFEMIGEELTLMGGGYQIVDYVMMRKI